jgi:prolyl-tRNA editing enzyme YbaK/EbsC (Cys-tRNA(Pro) deacylase)
MSLVTLYLADHHVPFEVLPHRQVLSSSQEADVLGVDAVVKTVVLATADGWCLAVIPASCRVDLHLVRDVLGDPTVRLASEAELFAAFPRYELGALPPLGGLLGVPVLLDPRVLGHETVVFAAGLETESVKAPTDELFREESKMVASIARDPELD